MFIVAEAVLTLFHELASSHLNELARYHSLPKAVQEDISELA